jgi:N-acetylmuramoyl-L-alanine amidase
MQEAHDPRVAAGHEGSLSSVTARVTAVFVAIATAAAGCGGGGDRTIHVNGPTREVPSLDPAATAQTTKAETPADPPAEPAAGAPKPTIVQKPIKFGSKRKAEMAAYSKRHYGDNTYLLKNPKVIVEHYTASNSFSSAWNTFDNDTPDVELHELPGTCSHFIVDRDGTIYQLVKTTIRCRHTVGLNYTAIGIEHVGTSDGSVMNNPKELKASLRLTRWLRCTNGIKVKNVIGHNESLSSPYHHENVARLRNQTHGDMTHATMTRYRKMLAQFSC